MRLKEENVGKHGGEKKNCSGTSNWLDLDLIYECTLLLFISLSCCGCSPPHSFPISSCIHMSNTKSQIWVLTCMQKKKKKNADSTACHPLQKVNNDLQCDFLRGHSGLKKKKKKIRVWLVHEGFFPIVHCPLHGCVTFRNTNNVLMMQYFHRDAPWHQVLQISLVCPLIESNN